MILLVKIASTSIEVEANSSRSVLWRTPPVHALACGDLDKQDHAQEEFSIAQILKSSGATSDDVS
jgi:hypothetical protein